MVVEAGALNWNWMYLYLHLHLHLGQHYKVEVQHDDQRYDDILEVRSSVHDDNEHGDIVQVHHADVLELEVHHDMHMQVQLGSGLLLVRNKNEAAAVKVFECRSDYNTRTSTMICPWCIKEYMVGGGCAIAE